MSGSVYYAGLVVVLVKELPKPYDAYVLFVSVVLYTLLAVANYVLLFTRGIQIWFF